MKTQSLETTTLSSKNKSSNFLLYTILLPFLIFLGLLSMHTITLSRPLLITIGIIGIVVISILALTDLYKLLLIFVLYLPFSKILPGDFGTGTWALNLTNIFLLLILLSLGIEKLKSGLNFIPKSSITIPVIIFCFFGTISFIKGGFYFGYAYMGHFIGPLKEWLTPIFLFFIFLIAVRDKHQIKQIITLIILITICISALTVFEYLGVKGAEDFEKTRVGTIFEQPNRAGAFFVYYSFLLVGVFLVNIRSVKYWPLIFPILISARALMYTYSRGAIVAFAAAGIFIASIKSKWLFILVCLFAMLALINPNVLPSSLRDRFASTITKQEPIYQQSLEDRLEPSAKTRIIIWKGALKMIGDRPFLGVGYGVFPYMINFYAPVGKRDPHNAYILIAAELGLIALGVFLWIIALIYKNTLFLYKKSKDKFIKSFALGFLAGIVGLLVCNIFGSRMDSQILMGFFWILTALVFKSKELLKKGQLN